MGSKCSVVLYDKSGGFLAKNLAGHSLQFYNEEINTPESSAVEITPSTTQVSFTVTTTTYNTMYLADTTTGYNMDANDNLICLPNTGTCNLCYMVTSEGVGYLQPFSVEEQGTCGLNGPGCYVGPNGCAPSPTQAQTRSLASEPGSNTTSSGVGATALVVIGIIAGLLVLGVVIFILLPYLAKKTRS